MLCDVQQVLKERASLVGDQGFWRAHAGGRTAGEDDGCEHQATSVPMLKSRFLASLGMTIFWSQFWPVTNDENIKRLRSAHGLGAGGDGLTKFALQFFVLHRCCVAPHGDEFSGDADGDFFRGARADRQTHCCVSSRKFLWSVSLFFERLIYR